MKDLIFFVINDIIKVGEYLLVTTLYDNNNVKRLHNIIISLC
jgi:hypothetical protein